MNHVTAFTKSRTRKFADRRPQNFTLSILRKGLHSSYGEYCEIIRLVEKGCDSIAAIEAGLRAWRFVPNRIPDGYIPTVNERGNL